MRKLIHSMDRKRVDKIEKLLIFIMSVIVKNETAMLSSVNFNLSI